LLDDYFVDAEMSFAADGKDTWFAAVITIIIMIGLTWCKCKHCKTVEIS